MARIGVGSYKPLRLHCVELFQLISRNPDSEDDQRRCHGNNDILSNKTHPVNHQVEATHGSISYVPNTYITQHTICNCSVQLRRNKTSGARRNHSSGDLSTTLTSTINLTANDINGFSKFCCTAIAYDNHSIVMEVEV